MSKDIEDEANGYFQRIYNHSGQATLTIEEVLDMLKKFKDSPNKREQVINNYHLYMIVFKCFYLIIISK